VKVMNANHTKRKLFDSHAKIDDAKPAGNLSTSSVANKLQQKKRNKVMEIYINIHQY